MRSECQEYRATSTGGGVQFITREELAEVLRVSLRTVDAMMAAEEIPFVRLRGVIIRFYLPDVVRQLTATALTRKSGRGARSVERESVECGGEGLKAKG
jgi:excisionase family DNA binding protein